MKKILILATMMAMVAGIFYSCTKNEGTKDGPIMNKRTNPQMSKEDSRITNLIIDFKKKMDFLEVNPSIKSDESKSVDSAVWYLEAATNFYYGDPGFEADAFDVKSTSFVVPKTNGEVLLTDIQVALNAIQVHLNNHYASIEENQKQLVVADVSKKEETSDQVVMEVSTGVKKSGPGASDPSLPYWYYWGMDMGNCSTSPYDPGPDAADVLTNALENEFLVDHPPLGGGTQVEIGGYYTDVSSFSYGRAPWDGGTVPFPTPSGYKLFYQNEVPDGQLDICIGQTDLDNYYAKMENWTNQHKPGGSDVEVSYILCKDVANPYDDPNGIGFLYDIRHSFQVNYGVWHYGANPK